jgi:hypothetical protein
MSATIIRIAEVSSGYACVVTSVERDGRFTAATQLYFVNKKTHCDVLEKEYVFGDEQPAIAKFQELLAQDVEARV